MNRRMHDGTWITRDCPRCRAKASQWCRNYKGQDKSPCPARHRGPAPKSVHAPDLEPVEQLTLFNLNGD